MTSQIPVEIKVNVAGDVDHALGLLPLEENPTVRSIFFLEDMTPGLRSAFPLFQAGIILRLRREESGDGDLTVKLRPCRRSQLTSGWRVSADGNGWKYVVEADWSGSRRVLAASCRHDVSAAKLDAALSTGAGWSALLDRRQREFLAECADLRLDPDGLVALEPVRVRRWATVHLDDNRVVVERWTVDDLDSLELSIRVGTEPEDGSPARRQEDFEAGLRALGIRISEEPQTKTQMLLEHLSAAVAV